jgi:hypothetical protein
MPPRMLDLFAIADGNAAVIEAGFEAILAGTTPERAALLREFAGWVETEGLVSINVQLHVVGDILNGKAYQNTYEFAQERAALSGRPAEDVLRERLQDLYDRRVGFDRAFTDGEKFRYGAMHAGGPGLTAYGPYCMVLTRRYQESLGQIAYLPGDSLKVCLGSDASLDEAAVRRSACPHSQRHLMVAAECAAPLIPGDRGTWPQLVASGERYFEVIFIGEVAFAAIERICVLKTEYDNRWQSAFESFGAKPDAATRALAHDFVVLRRAVVEGRLRLEVVP